VFPACQKEVRTESETAEAPEAATVPAVSTPGRQNAETQPKALSAKAPAWWPTRGWDVPTGNNANQTGTRPKKQNDVQAEVRMIASSEDLRGVAVAGGDQPVDLSREADRISKRAIEPGGRSEAKRGPIAEAGTPAAASDPRDNMKKM